MIVKAIAWACCTVFIFWLNPVVLADADFLDVRIKLEKDHSGRKGDPEGKYFHESTFHPHYDGRFAEKQVGTDERLDHLTALMQTFLYTMANLGAETWIMHGTLLGWWWNQKILPWDSDLDLQVSEETIYFLAKYYNMTEYHFSLPGLSRSKGRNYLLEINPHYRIATTEDKFNVIDARWIDTETGLFIDISTVRKNWTAIAQGIEGALMCKDRHHYLAKDIFPLRDSLFEGFPVKIPYAYSWLLEEEYGKEALVVTQYEYHEWNETTQLWEPMSYRPRSRRGRRPPFKPPPPRGWAWQGAKPTP